METHHEQQLGHSTHLFYVSYPRRQDCCIQLNEEAGLARVGAAIWEQFQVVVSPG